jgi:hypothetical protein
LKLRCTAKSSTLHFAGAAKFRSFRRNMTLLMRYRAPLDASYAVVPAALHKVHAERVASGLLLNRLTVPECYGPA